MTEKQQQEEALAVEQVSAQELDRRKFLGGLGGAALAATAAGAVTSMASSAEAQEDDLVARHGGGGGGCECQLDPDSPQHRRNNAEKIKKDAAKAEKQLGAWEHDCNEDECNYPDMIGQFHKTLPHDPVTGLVDPAAYAAMLVAVESGDYATWETVPKGVPGVSRFLNPLGALSYNLEGPDTAAVPVPAAPSVDSAETASEWAEVAWMSLLNDVSFVNYGTDANVAAACASLSAYSDFRGPKVAGAVTPQTLFRMDSPGCLDGPIVSQFLLRAFFYDGINVQPLITTALPNQFFMTQFNEWLTVQNGGGAGFFGALDPVVRRPRNARDLGQVCNLDRIYSAYFRALLILQALFPFAASAGLDANHPYQTATRQAGFATFGLAEIADLVGGSGKGERHTWYSKWQANRRIRPEGYGGLVHTNMAGLTTHPIHPDVTNDTDLMNRIFAVNQASNIARGLGTDGTWLLPMGVRTGSPTHPSYPAGHAFSAGVGVTILKAFYNEAQPFPGAVKLSADGLTAPAYVVGVDGPQLTIGGELNKLAHNLAYGRNMSGVHYRSDNSSGLAQGEEVAIRFLAEKRTTYLEPFNGFNLTKFDGTSIVI